EGIGSGVVANQVVDRLVNLDPVEHEVVGLCAIAVYGQNSAADIRTFTGIRSTEAGRIRRNRARGVQRELLEIAIRQRDILDGVIVERGGQFGILGIEQRGQIPAN